VAHVAPLLSQLAKTTWNAGSGAIVSPNRNALIREWKFLRVQWSSLHMILHHLLPFHVSIDNSEPHHVLKCCMRPPAQCRSC
jgi:hypothetical protein